MTDDRTDLLNIAEVADELRSSRTTVQNLLNSRRLEYVQIGRRRFIPRRALDAYLDAQTRKAVNADQAATDLAVVLEHRDVR